MQYFNIYLVEVLAASNTWIKGSQLSAENVDSVVILNKGLFGSGCVRAVYQVVRAGAARRANGKLAKFCIP